MPELLQTHIDELRRVRDLVDRRLDELLPAVDAPPAELHAAMRYSIMAGGKRLRPVLAVSAFQACNGNGERIYDCAAALEMLHTYSLIHDDLPCMDDDDFRRGQPTLHKKYPEYIAVLAGDALHALAFEILAASGSREIVIEVSRAIGTRGMIGGQVADVQAEGRPVTIAEVEGIHRRKTAALITSSVKIGAMLAGASAATIQQLEKYGENLGLAFQIIDDVLDIEGDFAALGKSVGADQLHEKATYPKVVGVEESRRIAGRLIENGKAAIAELPECESLCRLADFILSREQ